MEKDLSKKLNEASSSYNDNQQQIADETVSEDGFDILSMTLPLRPGSDLFSKNLLRAQNIKNIIITAVIGNGITGEAYTVGANEQNDGRRADIIYLPLKEFARALPPVIIEIQSKVNPAFVTRSIRYCLNTFDDVKTLPVLVVICIDGFSSRKFRDSAFEKLDSNPFYTHPCQSWAKKVYIYAEGSIENHIKSSPINPMVALAHVLISQEKNIMMLEEYDDPTIQDIYKTALHVFSDGKDKTNDLKRNCESFCEAMTSQFTKIMKYEKDGSEQSRKRIRQYAQDGIDFIKQFNRRNLSDSSATPIRATTPEEPSDDLIFVEEERAQSAGRFNWVSCFEKGSAEGKFTRYSSHLTLKQAYSRQTL
ncbi:hypothetical protein BDF20DRAFT_920734 [Mycotypha africana]|uniref:uncharacterized protein n=1 Tax=Mycotypha africana TaxID=64632 RepID=UPI002300052B|nr:uncharacterized protein BDF20DRAFT_920734 [Mycotypha africana]KAI8991733.1 hypothetical protein BDF20DRAFT_920734 [Mycotypha africana]